MQAIIIGLVLAGIIFYLAKKPSVKVSAKAHGFLTRVEKAKSNVERELIRGEAAAAYEAAEITLSELLKISNRVRVLSE